MLHRSPSPPVHASLNFSTLSRGMLAVLALLIGLFSLRYALPGAPLHAPLPNFRTHYPALIIHTLCSATALILSPWQFSDRARHYAPLAHRITGYLYLTLVFTGGISALALARNAAFGILSSLGFGSLAVMWILSAGMGLLCVLRHNIAAHQNWMTRCFALTAAAITLRFLLPLSSFAGLPMAVSYPYISWLCWVPNLLFAEYYLRKRKTHRYPVTNLTSSLTP